MTHTSYSQSKNIKWLWLTPAFIFIIALLSYWLKFSGITLDEDFLNQILSFIRSPLEYLSSNPSDWGTFGDYLGGLLNPMIGGCTLIVAISVWRSQENELKQTKELLKVQLEKVDQDRAEQRFFDLINIYQKVVDGITPHPVNPHKLPQEVNGIKIDSYAYSKLLEPYQQRQSQLLGKAALQDWRLKLDDNEKIFATLDTKIPTENLIKTFNLYWERSEAELFLLSYFETIAKILINSEKLLKGDHYHYVQIFKSQLSHAELILIAYYLIATKNQEFTQKSINYHLLENIKKKT
jgi:hypothetical protein